MIFWRKIVIFHTKYPNNFPPLGAIFLSAPPPLTWNPGSAPDDVYLLVKYIYLVNASLIVATL